MNPSLFKSTVSTGSPKYVAPADTTNEAGGRAYKRDAKDALAQFAVTGCLSDTFYASAETQLADLLKLISAPEITNEYIAKLAIYARKANMKDMPAMLCAALVIRGSADSKSKAHDLFRSVAPAVLDNLKMIANFIKMLRSGVVQAALVGGKSTSLPRPARKYVESWLTSRNPDRLLNDSTGIDPGLGDIIKMIHPKPKNPSQAAVFAYFMGKLGIKDATGSDSEAAPTLPFVNIPKSIRDFELFKTASVADRKALIGSINFRRLDALGLVDDEWVEIARSASWQTARMNLATFARHNVFKTKGVAELLATRLADAEQVKASRALPYQLFVAYKTTSENADVPMMLKSALQDAFETSLSNVPKINGDTVIAVDISGSMSSPITGTQEKRQASKVSCREAAALTACSILRVNPSSTRTLQFHTAAAEVVLNPRDSVFTNTVKLGSGGGGTDCSTPIKLMISKKIKADTVIIISDYESWADSVGSGRWGGAASPTGLAAMWAEYRRTINPKAKLICIDITPSTTAQITHSDKTGVYHVGGFSDAVFEYISTLASSTDSRPGQWVELIEKTEIPALVASTVAVTAA